MRQCGQYVRQWWHVMQWGGMIGSVVVSWAVWPVLESVWGTLGSVGYLRQCGGTLGSMAVC